MRSQARDCSVPLKLTCIPAVIAGLRACARLGVFPADPNIC